MNYDISTIVLTHNSYTRKFGCIEHTILSLLNQRAVHQEIIIVDNSTIQEDQADLRNFVTSLQNSNIVLVNCNQSIGNARNFGVSHASADIYVFVDEDTILLSDDVQERLGYQVFILDTGVRFPLGSPKETLRT